jgi:diguanylate cyclase (GGDEF)-like protein
VHVETGDVCASLAHDCGLGIFAGASQAQHATASARTGRDQPRYGGEEFALVLEGTDRTGARQLAERIRQEVGAQKHDSAKGAFRATLSLGVAVYPEDGKSKQELIANADQALYAAKHGGRNRTVCHGEIVRAKDAPPAARAAG